MISSLPPERYVCAKKFTPVCIFFRISVKLFEKPYLIYYAYVNKLFCQGSDLSYSTAYSVLQDKYSSTFRIMNSKLLNK